MKKQFIKQSWILALAALTFAGCKKEKTAPPTEVKVEGQFLVASNANNNTYLVASEKLDDENGSITIIGNGLEVSGIYSNYMQDGFKGFVAINYGRGDAHLGNRFSIASDGKPFRIGAQFEVANGFTTAGIVGDAAYTIMSGGWSSDLTKGTVNKIPMSSGAPTNKPFTVNNFKGFEGKNARLIGVADAGNSSFYTGLDFGTAGGVDNAVVAKISANSLNAESVYSDNRIGMSGGVFRSAVYSQIEKADNGDVFVFSGNQNGKKTAGAVVLRSGANGFDPNYYWDIEKASGGYRFRRVWHVTEDKFLLEVYNEPVAIGTAIPFGLAATQFAIVDMSNKSFNLIKGIPAKADLVDLMGVSWPYVFQGKLYMGISTSLEPARIYVIDPQTTAAKKGIKVVGAAAIDAITFVEKAK